MFVTGFTCRKATFQHHFTIKRFVWCYTDMIYQLRIQQVKHTVVLGIKVMRYSAVFSQLFLVTLHGCLPNYRSTLLHICHQYILGYKNQKYQNALKCVSKKQPGPNSHCTVRALPDSWNKWHFVCNYPSSFSCFCVHSVIIRFFHADDKQ